MSRPWPAVQLGEVLARSGEIGTILPSAKYREITVKLWGKGVVLRGIVSGAQIAGGRRFVAKAGQLILSRIDARNGAIGIVPDQLDGAVVTNDFPLFHINHNRLNAAFLHWMSRTANFVDLCKRASEGTTNRVRLQEDRFLALEIPIPSLSEQRLIVARIEEIGGKIEEASSLRGQAIGEAEGLVKTRAKKLLVGIGGPVTELRRWLDPSRDGIQTGPFGAQLSSHEFQDLGVPVLTIGNVQYGGLDLDGLKHVSGEKAQQLNRYTVQEGDILFARMGTVGRCCVVPRKAEGWLINYHIIRVALNRSRVDSRFVLWTIRCSEDVERYLEETIRGATREGVNSRIVGSLPCRVPSLDEQHRIVSYLDGLQAKVDALTRLQAETAAELDALLPSILDKAFKGEL